MDDDSNVDEGSHGGIVEKAKDAIGNVMGGNAGSAEIDDRMQEDATAGSSPTNAVTDPLASTGTGYVGGADSAGTGTGSGVGYGSEMGGGAPDTSLDWERDGGVRSAYDRSTDEPGSFSEGERSDRDESLT